MYPETSVWLIIVLAIVCANLPFLTERMLAFVPARMAGESEKFAGYYLVRALISYVLIGCAFYLLTEPAFPLSANIFGLAAFILLFAVPGFIYDQKVTYKPLAVHLVELALLVTFVAAVGFFIESYYANRFTQSWQFYAIGISIFIVLAFPGFTWRHLMRHPHRPQKSFE